MKLALVTFLLASLSASICADDKQASKSIRIPCSTWFHGYLHMADAVVVGRISEVTERNSDIDPESKVFSYSLGVSAFGGDCPELKGVTEIRSENHNPVKKGDLVIMLVHYYENKPNLATGSRPLDVIKSVDDPIAKLFISKGINYQNYTDADMLVLKEAMPVEYENILPRREFSRNNTESEQDAP
jgi:hypothetical protein